MESILSWKSLFVRRERLEAEGVDTLDATKKVMLLHSTMRGLYYQLFQSVELLEVQREAATRIAATWKMMLAKRVSARA